MARRQLGVAHECWKEKQLNNERASRVKILAEKNNLMNKLTKHMNRMFTGQGIQKAAICPGSKQDLAQGIKLNPADGRAERGQNQPWPSSVLGLLASRLLSMISNVLAVWAAFSSFLGCLLWASQVVLVVAAKTSLIYRNYAEVLDEEFICSIVHDGK